MRIALAAATALLAASCEGPGRSGAAASPVEVRPPAVAGSFYPADGEVLASLVDSLIDAADPPAVPAGEIVAGVAPHAGYVYSAPTAALLYQCLEGRRYDVVYVIAPAHTAPVLGFSVYDGGPFLTPMGAVEIDTAAARRLIRAHPSCSRGGSEHAGEHAVEVQLPFLLSALEPGWRLVPVLAGSTDPNSIRLLAELLYAESADASILVIASSDLSHYPPLALSRTADSVTMAAWSTLPMEGFLDATSRARLPRGVETFACGRIPMAVVLAYSELFGNAERTVLGMASSADAGGNPESVVGYASAVVTADPAAARAPLGTETRLELCRIVEENLSAAATRSERPPLPSAEGDMGLLRGVFVTYTEGGLLRGCIGTIRPVYPLGAATAMMAWSAALEDPRFPPITAGELGSIEYEISVLTPLELMDDPLSVRLGTDGLYIVRGGASGVLLPQVPGEAGWTTPQEFLEGLCQKAGLPPGSWADGAAIYRFQAQVFGPAPTAP